MLSFCDIVTKQASIADSDLTGPLGLVVDYKIGMIVSGRSEAAFQTLRLEPVSTDLPSLYCGVCSLLSVSSKLHSLHRVISNRHFYGDVTYQSLRVALISLVCEIEPIDDQQLLDGARTISVDDICQMDPKYCLVSSVMSMLDNRNNRLAPTQVFNKPILGETNRYYYPLLPHDLFWEVGFKLHTWDFIGSMQPGQEDESEEQTDVYGNAYTVVTNGLKEDECCVCGGPIASFTHFIYTANDLTMHLNCFHAYNQW